MPITIAPEPGASERAQPSGSNTLLDWIERTGNRLPDPAFHFLIALAVTWLLSALLASVSFDVTDPRTSAPLRVNNLLTGKALTEFLAGMVSAFISFPPLGLVLVMVLGVGVAEHAGLFRAALSGMLALSPRRLLAPMLATAAVASHIVADAAIVLIVPLGGALFYAAGRHPLAGIVLAYAAMVGGFAANFLPSGLDPILAGFTERAAQIVDPARTVNPLSNWFVMAGASTVVVLGSWWITERIVEPRLAAVPVDGDPAGMPEVRALTRGDRRGLLAAGVVGFVMLVGLAAAALPAGSPFRAADGTLSGPGSPLMRAIIPIMFLLTVVPGTVFGILAGTVTSHRDIIKAMATATSTVSYYVVMVFFAALFTKAFADSNLGALLALEGAAVLQAIGLPPFVTIVGVILLSASVNLIVTSASAKWALLAPILVPMLMATGISPELTQMAYRVGDGATNIVTPLSPYFPLLVAFSVRYVRGTGIGTLIALMMPYSILFLITLTLVLAAWWGMGLPLGIQGGYAYP
jgi:aminobenzoyl-glutamate transport protein